MLTERRAEIEKVSTDQLAAQADRPNAIHLQR
jgi:hypothetical protein